MYVEDAEQSIYKTQLRANALFLDMFFQRTNQ